LAATEPVYILDACAVIALLHGEQGSGEVAALLEEPENRCRIHALNLCEVFYDGLRRSGLSDAARLEALLARNGIDIETEIPRSLWESAGQLKVALRISLADCFALALALQEKGTMVTSDHKELDRVAAAGICPIQFIR
jgi:PIN domain nuclease of toxin-antitoxin system